MYRPLTSISVTSPSASAMGMTCLTSPANEHTYILFPSSFYMTESSVSAMTEACDSKLPASCGPFCPCTSYICANLPFQKRVKDLQQSIPLMFIPSVIMIWQSVLGEASFFRRTSTALFEIYIILKLSFIFFLRMVWFKMVTPCWYMAERICYWAPPHSSLVIGCAIWDLRGARASQPSLEIGLSADIYLQRHMTMQPFFVPPDKMRLRWLYEIDTILSWKRSPWKADSAKVST